MSEPSPDAQPHPPQSPTSPSDAGPAGSAGGAGASAAVGPVRPRGLHRSALQGGDVAQRAWLPLGTLDSGVLANVDVAGAVQLAGASWYLDWWVGAEDRWHHPSREAAVRQSPVGDSPVVETALRVPGGDVVARAFAAQSHAGDWRGAGIIVEVENRTAVPVALAFVIRPLSLDGSGHISAIRSDGAAVVIDGIGGSGRAVPSMLLARDPARTVSGDFDTVAPRLASGDDSILAVDVTSPSGDAEAAFVVPLAHTATARVLLPVTHGDRRGAPRPTTPWEAPDAAAVAKGWAVHSAGRSGGTDLRVVVPEADWDRALIWSSAMLRLAGADELGACLDRHRGAPAGPPASARAAEVAEAMCRLNAADALVPIARGLADAQRLGGEVRLGDRSDGTVALLHSIAGALAGAEDPEGPAAEQFVAPAAVAIRRLRKRKGLVDELVASAIRALRSVAPPLIAVGQPEVAEDALAVAAALSSSTGPARSALSVGSATSVVPEPSNISDTSNAPSASNMPGAVRSTFATALAARSLVASGADDAVAAVRALWSTAVGHGRSDAVSSTGADGAAAVAVGLLGFDVAELAARANAVLDVVVSQGVAGPALLSAFDRSWLGQQVEAHGVPTPWGATSYALRWHGERPALLWEVEAEPGSLGAAGTQTTESAAPFTVTAPGLDPTWSGSGADGEALLGVPAVAGLLKKAPSDASEVSAADVVEVDQGSTGGGSGDPATSTAHRVEEPTVPGEGDSFG